MLRRRISVLVLVSAMLSLCAEAQAQRQVGSYTPSKPTLSPYLWLTRPNNGPLPNYQTFVQPLKNQAQIDSNQQYDIQDLQQGQQQQTQQQLQFQQQSAQQQSQWKITPPAVAPTGIAAGFNNLGGYYGGSGASGGQKPQAKGKQGGSKGSSVAKK